MTDYGVFAVNRGIWTHPIFAPEAFTEREAWMWMCGAAAFKPMRARAGRVTVELQRGQLAFATRFMASKWRWSEARVRRFLKRLQTDAMVTLQTTRDTTLITICNYEKHAFGRRTDDALSDAQTDAQTTHPRRKEEELKNLKKCETPSAPLFERTDEADLFDRGKKILGADAGGLIARLLKSKKGSIPLARAAIEQASTKESPREYIGAVIRGPVHERHGPNDQHAGQI